MNDIQDRILTIMSIKNLTNAEFAEAIGVQPSNISHILSGRNKPSLDLVMKIVKRYPEVRLEWLLQGDGSMNKEFGIDLFSTQKPDLPKIERESPSNESKIQGKGRDFDKTGSSFEVKREPEDVKMPINQEDRAKQAGADKEDRKNQLSVDLANSDVEIEKIVVFYSDKTFKEYCPGRH
jgi:transcriptional regulator with XRE-family HTH domain